MMDKKAAATATSIVGSSILACAMIAGIGFSLQYLFGEYAAGIVTTLVVVLGMWAFIYRAERNTTH